MTFSWQLRLPLRDVHARGTTVTYVRISEIRLSLIPGQGLTNLSGDVFLSLTSPQVNFYKGRTHELTHYRLYR
jgi:hypothetical protein